MHVWRALDEVPADLGPTVVTIGNFDGVHHGHRHVLRTATAYAADRGIPTVAVTFDPHPLEVLIPAKAPARLADLDTRLGLLAEAGADAVLVVPFDLSVAAWTPDEFLDRVVVHALQAAVVVVGDNFRFGNRASGDVAYLAEHGSRHGYVVDGLRLDADDDEVYSSTLVRGLVASGDVEGAARALTRWHRVSGMVVEGDRRGREMGFPTANLPALHREAVPADGVYAGWTRVADDEVYLPSAISVGTNPTFDGVERRVESYVLDRDDLDLYGRTVEVLFAARVRGQVRYEGVEALVAQMHDDVARVRDLLAGLDPHAVG